MINISKSANVIIETSKKSKHKILNLSDCFLKEIPEEISKMEHIEVLILNDNFITEIKNLPINLKRIIAVNNKIQQVLKGTFTDNIEFINLDKNLIQCVEDNLKNATYLNLSNNCIFDMSFVKGCNSLHTLLLNNNNIGNFVCPCEELKILEISHNKLTNIDRLPKNLNVIKASHNNIKIIESLPFGLKICHLDRNNIKHINWFPSMLHDINVSFNELERLPTFPATIKICDVSYNALSSLMGINLNVISLNISYNKFTDINEFSHVKKLISDGNNLKEHEYGAIETKTDSDSLDHMIGNRGDIVHNHSLHIRQSMNIHQPMYNFGMMDPHCIIPNNSYQKEDLEDI